MQYFQGRSKHVQVSILIVIDFRVGPGHYEFLNVNAANCQPLTFFAEIVYGAEEIGPALGTTTTSTKLEAGDSFQEMEESERSVEDLLGAIDKAPTFGLNARELILQASRRIAAQVRNPYFHPTYVVLIPPKSLTHGYQKSSIRKRCQGLALKHHIRTSRPLTVCCCEGRPNWGQRQSSKPRGRQEKAALFDPVQEWIRASGSSAHS